MRQFLNPWAHWSGFAPFPPDQLCPLNQEPPPIPGPFPTTEIASDDLRLLERIGAGSTGANTYAAIPLGELSMAASGHDLSSFIALASRVIDADLAESLRFPSQRILCEASVGITDAWSVYRSMMLARGFPTPYHALDVLDPAQRADALGGFTAYLGRRAEADPFQVGAELMSDTVEEAVGFVPSPSDDAPTILRQMCIRCHDRTAPSGSRRARFDAETVDALSTDGAATVWKRLTAPRSSPELMPPLRAGQLPAWALERLRTFLRIP
ncbi:MAG TPA: hypothetical protein VHU40_14630 [Polyangia bacterium]|nr:hypothetical protein [Polyangia bacterium]